MQTKKLKKISIPLLALFTAVLSVFLPIIMSFFSDHIFDDFLLYSSNIDVEIRDFYLESGEETYLPDEDNNTTLVLSHKDIAIINFSVKNTGVVELNYEGLLGLAWLNDALSEGGRIYLYPVTISDEDILEELESGVEISALINSETSDTSTVTTSSGERNGLLYQYSDYETNLEGSQTSPETQDYSYKIVYYDANTTIDYIDVELEVVIEANASGVVAVNWMANDTKNIGLKTDATEVLKPMIELIGDDVVSVETGTSYTELGAIATNYAGETLSYTVSGEVDPMTKGTYYITYTVNYNGFEESVVRTVVVETTIPPVIYLNEEYVERYITTDPWDFYQYIDRVEFEGTTIPIEEVVITTPTGYDPELSSIYDIKFNITKDDLTAEEVSLNAEVFKFVQLEAGQYHFVALTSHGKVYTWGNGSNGRLGHGSTSNLNTPKRVEAIEDLEIIQVEAGFDSTFAITSDGLIYSWGNNNYGQLGNAAASSTSVPELVVSSDTSFADARFNKMTVHDSAVYALSTDQRLYVWGQNNYGHLGVGYTLTSGLTSHQRNPLKLKLIDDGGNEELQPLVVDVFSGEHAAHVLANDPLTGELILFAFGSNNYGEFGNNENFGNAISTPQNITEKFGSYIPVTEISFLDGGYDQTLAVTTSGDIFAWGYGGNGRLGHGNSTSYNYPKQIEALSNVKQAWFGHNHAMAITNDGILYSWGYNEYGKLGIGSTTSQNLPVVVTLVTNDEPIAAAISYHSSAYLTEKGYVYAFGRNNYGQIGNASSNSSETAPTTPVVVE